MKVLNLMIFTMLLSLAAGVGLGEKAFAAPGTPRPMEAQNTEVEKCENGCPQKVSDRICPEPYGKHCYDVQNNPLLLQAFGKSPIQTEDSNAIKDRGNKGQ